MIEFLRMSDRALGTLKRAPTAEARWKIVDRYGSVPPAATVKAPTTKHEQNEEDD
jgi:hypothetical protein